MKPARTYTREHLIDICERAIVQESKWHDRDSSRAQERVGSCWALLQAGCDFHVMTSGRLVTDDRTIWVEVYPRGFQSFEWGREEGRAADSESFYLPTEARLEAYRGEDWY